MRGVDVTLREVRPGDVEHVAAHMREMDVKEVRALGDTPLQGLQRSVKGSIQVYTALVDGEPAAIIGTAPLAVIGGVGSPWMLGTDKVRLRRRAVMRLSRAYIHGMRQMFPTLLNYVHVDNKASVQWLESLGFEILPPVPYGRNGEMFHPFKMQS